MSELAELTEAADAGGYDAVLLLSFGGPEGPEDVMPFLRNVTRGRGIPEERLTAVAEHYQQLRGVSPINAANRALLAALSIEFAERGIDLPLYWGNRNWKPYVADAVRHMRDDGIQRALVFATSATASYSACRQYRGDLAQARAVAGDGAPELVKLRHFFDHPGFVAANADGVRAALDALPPAERDQARLVFTAHSIPVAMNDTLRARGERALRRAAPRERPAGGRGGARPGRRVRPGLAVALRSAGRALAGAGRQRPPARPGRGRHDRRGGEPDRVHRRPRRGRVGSRQRGPGHGRSISGCTTRGPRRPAPTRRS